MIKEEEISYYVVAYPEWLTGDYDRIQEFRKRYDHIFYPIIEPHFTFVFSIPNVHLELVLEELKRQAATLKKIRFRLTHAVLHKEDWNDCHFSFLIPEDGYEQMIQWHQRLYADQLNTFLRKDIPYTPHITIGSSNDALLGRRMVDEWNKDAISIIGTLHQLTLVRFDHQHITPIHRMTLLS